jgi:hypothetical protein
VFTFDIRRILRSLARGPAFTIPAVATLAFGLAGVVGIMAITDMVVLNPLPWCRGPHGYAGPLSAVCAAFSG